MSTRATYRFHPGDRFLPTTTIYIHYDGYEDGAAMYFYNCLNTPSKGCLATQFIRANAGAELTQSHDVHGDTEYRYDVWEGNDNGRGYTATLKVSKRHGFGESEQWNCCYVGTIGQFITKHTGLIENYEPFSEVTLGYGCKRWLNRKLADDLLNGEGLGGKMRTARVWRQNGHDKGANWAGLMNDITALITAFPVLRTEEIDALLAVMANE